jgi:choline dehydrogenase-like flavoprotein
MPPLPLNNSARVLQAGAEKLGLSTFSPPFLINSVHRDGRDACIACGSCVGFPCPSDAKNGTHNTVIPRALASGHCTLVTAAMVTSVDHDARGRVSGLSLVETEDASVHRRRTVRAKAVVLSAGAIETARLLLMSRSTIYPDGIGNHHDIVGRNLQGHYYPTVFALFREPVHDCFGPGVTIATCDFNHGNKGVMGGAMIANDFIMPPMLFWETALPPDLRPWGAGAKHFMRDNFRHVAQVKGPVQEVPDPDCRVTLADITDCYGLPVARLSGATHPETVRTAAFIQERCFEWVRASGAIASWGKAPTRHMSAGQHQAGTCRMGKDPRNSVTDAFGRVWGHDNLFICDGSLHPTNGGFNPVLTIMALAFRNGEHIAQSI